jgi:hypothetical protein
MKAGNFRGLYRTAAWAYVTNGTTFHAPEPEYRAFKYQPDYDNLPWQEAYLAAKDKERNTDDNKPTVSR